MTLIDPDDDAALLDAEVVHRACIIKIEQDDWQGGPGAIVRATFLPTKAQAAMLAVFLDQFAKS